VRLTNKDLEVFLALRHHHHCHSLTHPFLFNIQPPRTQQQISKGWDEGVMEMSLGEKAVLHITSDYGYGAGGAGDGVIPPNADLDFEVELLQIGDKKAAAVTGGGASCCVVL
jgi:hypothetical protein